MRIVFLTANPFPSYSGGMENWLYHVLRVLNDETDIEATVVSPQSDAEPFYDLTPFERVSLARTREIGKRRVKQGFLRGPLTVFRLVTTAFNYALWANDCRRVLKRCSGRDDVIVVVQSIPGMIPVVLLKSLMCRRRVVCSMRGRIGYDLKVLGHSRLARLYIKLERFVLRYADVIHSNGEDTALYVAQELGRGSTVVPNGVQSEVFANSRPLDEANEKLEELEQIRRSGMKIVMTVASLRDIKGIRFLIEAASHMKAAGKPGFRVVFVGKGDQEPYRRYAAELGVDDLVVFTGEQKQVSSFLQFADVAVAISGGGGVSNAVVEMMAAKKPVVAWDSSTYSQIVTHGKSGYLVPEHDSKALAEGITRLLQDEDYASALAAAARDTAAHYDWRNVVPRFLELVTSRQ